MVFIYQVKYSIGYNEPISNIAMSDNDCQKLGKKSKEMINSTTQTESCSTEDGINPRALSDGSTGQLVRYEINDL